jgi:hypothetical protein
MKVSPPIGILPPPGQFCQVGATLINTEEMKIRKNFRILENWKVEKYSKIIYRILEIH